MQVTKTNIKHMMYLKVDNGYSMETIFTSNDFNEMEARKKQAQDLFPDRQVIVTTN